jgi:cobalamin biosynthesis Mg chelatase CobN
VLGDEGREWLEQLHLFWCGCGCWYVFCSYMRCVAYTERTERQTNERTNERTKETNEGTERQTDKQSNKLTNEQMNERTNERTNNQTFNQTIKQSNKTCWSEAYARATMTLSNVASGSRPKRSQIASMLVVVVCGCVGV